MNYIATMTGRELEQARKRKGLTRNDLARLLKITYVTVWRWEQDKTPINGPVEKAVKAVFAES